ncbi:MAG: hypothetical protein J7M15_01180, partial [Anaerolineae bacterium]|nr:hypothetical protein [Anaerolineae bacterium]
FRAPYAPLSVQYPAGWRVISDLDDEGQFHIVLARSRWVRVHIIALGDVDAKIYALESFLGGSPVAGSYRSIEILHIATTALWSTLFGEIREGRAVPTIIGGRRAVWSQFEYSEGLVEPGDETMRGLRATLLTRRQGVLMSAVAPRRYWSDFQPIALQIMSSVRVNG